MCDPSLGRLPSASSIVKGERDGVKVIYNDCWKTGDDVEKEKSACNRMRQSDPGEVLLADQHLIFNAEVWDSSS